MWFLNEADVRLFQQCGGTLYRLFIGKCIRNVVQTTPVTRVKTQDELFRRRTAKVDGIRIFADLIKAPDVCVKARVRFESWREKRDVADLPNFQRHTMAVPYGRFNLQ